jgi:hypothetical protein
MQPPEKQEHPMAGSLKRHLQLFTMVVAATGLAAAALATGLGILPSSANAANNPAMVFESGASTVYATGNLLRIGPEKSQVILGTAMPAPGEAIQGTVTVMHLGDTPSEFLLSTSGSADAAPPSGDDLAAMLRLIVVDRTTGLTLYDGPIVALETVSAGRFDADECHTFEFTVTRPEDGGSPGDAATDDNREGGIMTVAFDWSESE